MLARACRNGITDCVGALTGGKSVGRASDLRVIGLAHPSVSSCGRRRDGSRAQARFGRRARVWDHGMRSRRRCATKGTDMSKRGRKRRSRAGSAANHGKRPNA
ncbi:hypothetical protein CCO02nite_21340 [Cellulomonas composti]|uniref:Uncharacterized protein n=2 Tax=Cellulomonas TaxID=1707 RepID=A0A511JBX0_9CELL|nr:hypothetical protein CCO02nite_21340 [Cellulomonas composti]